MITTASTSGCGICTALETPSLNLQVSLPCVSWHTPLTAIAQPYPSTAAERVEGWADSSMANASLLKMSVTQNLGTRILTWCKWMQLCISPGKH